MAERIYVITRSDLSAGFQSAQSAHAVADFCLANPAQARSWDNEGGWLINLSVPTERDLFELYHQLLPHVEAGDPATSAISIFREPDLALEMTAIAVLGTPSVIEQLAGLPLALSTLDPQANDLARTRERALRSLSEKMENCNQSPGQTILAHGWSVREHFFTLLDHLNDDINLHQSTSWRLPAWIDDYADNLRADIDPYLADRYTIIHDCGKPFAMSTDDSGNQHFAGHAKISAETWTKFSAITGPGADDRAIIDMIASDMDFHTIGSPTGPDTTFVEFVANPHAATLMLAGLAALHANAAIFGGVDSTSFKIKFKRINKRGRAVCEAVYGPPAPGAKQLAKPTTTQATSPVPSQVTDPNHPQALRALSQVNPIDKLNKAAVLPDLISQGALA